MATTKSELLRVLTAAAGLPMNVDQIVEQMPVGTDRAKVGELCRELKDQGLLTATVEEGRVAYALADPLPANVTPIIGRRQNHGHESTLDKVRELLGKAKEPMTLSDVVAALPGEEQKKIQRALYQGAHRGEFESKPAGARAKAYAPKGGGIAIAIARSPAAADAPAPSDPADQVPPGSPLEQALQSAEKARDAYLEFVVASQSVWQALETSVTACRTALEAQRHA